MNWKVNIPLIHWLLSPSHHSSSQRFVLIVFKHKTRSFMKHMFMYIFHFLCTFKVHISPIQIEIAILFIVSIYVHIMSRVCNNLCFYIQFSKSPSNMCREEIELPNPPQAKVLCYRLFAGREDISWPPTPGCFAATFHPLSK